MEIITRKLRQFFTMIVLGAAALALLRSPEIAVDAVSSGLTVCAKTVLPSLFPFFVLTNLWIATGNAASFSRLAAPLMERVFHISGPAAPALVLGAIGGYPVGAQVTAQLFKSGDVERDTAHKMLFFCCNAGPAFLIAVAGAGVFQSVWIGALLYAIHIVSALLLGFFFRPRRIPLHNQAQRQGDTPALSTAFTVAVRQAGETALQVCAFVLIFSMISEFMQRMAPPTWQACPWYSLLLGSLELASGIGRLAGIPWSNGGRFVAAAVLTGWGGLCVHCQTFSLLDCAGLEKGAYLRGKALHALLSGGLALAVAPILSYPVACMGQTPERTYVLTQLALLLLLAAAAGWLLKITTGNYLRHRL